MPGARHAARAARSLRVVLTIALAAGAAQPARAADDLRLVEAARRNDPAAVRVLLAEGLDVDARHPDGATALLWTTHYDDAETAALLIAAGADANARAGKEGETPYTWLSPSAVWSWRIGEVALAMTGKGGANRARSRGAMPATLSQRRCCSTPARTQVREPNRA